MRIGVRLYRIVDVGEREVLHQLHVVPADNRGVNHKKRRFLGFRYETELLPLLIRVIGRAVADARHVPFLLRNARLLRAVNICWAGKISDVFFVDFW